MGLNIHRAGFFLLLFAATASGQLAAATQRAALAPGLVAVRTERQEIFLEALPERGEGLLAFARRLTGSSRHAAAVAAANGDVATLLAGVRYAVPFALLEAELQLRTLEALFERDFVAAPGWYHQVGPAHRGGREELWSVAEWFTGRGDNYRVIRQRNGLEDDVLAPGQTIVIPARLLRPALRSALPRDSPYYLEYARDGDGEYALYRLKAGEALYSSVVVRFTGRIFADDVNALAEEIAARSGIRDVTGIPVDFAVKIPFDLLLPEFLPASDPRRAEYEAGVLAAAQFTNTVVARHLDGITIILDSGHGGRDVGASVDGVWESVYVYDIMVRVKDLLESSTGARVEVTLRDGDAFTVPDRDVLERSRAHRILTQPAYAIEDSTVALHLRWYLANAFLGRALERDPDSEKVVFVSIHADSLHPSLRGAMAYIPGARFRGGSYRKRGAVYEARQEVRERPEFSISEREKLRSEGLSRELAESLIAAFQAAGLPVHEDKPVREKVIRQHREWVPAVLRYNAVPAQLLLEVCNLANAEDRRAIQTRAFRQRVAEAIASGLIDYYADGAPPAPRLARAAR